MNAVVRLSRSNEAWGGPRFEQVFKDELAGLRAGWLPLQQGLRQGSHANDHSVQPVLLGTSEDQTHLRVKCGLFYTSIIPGCACADDPTPESEYTEYCVVQIDIDKVTAEAGIALLDEDGGES